MTNNSDRYKVDKDQVNDKNLRIASHKGANVSVKTHNSKKIITIKQSLYTNDISVHRSM